MSKPKKDLLAGLKPLKKVEGNLPYIFDLYWDLKTADDIVRWDMQDDPELRRLLAEHSYDVKEWVDRMTPFWDLMEQDCQVIFRTSDEMTFLKTKSGNFLWDNKTDTLSRYTDEIPEIDDIRFLDFGDDVVGKLCGRYVKWEEK